MMKENNLVAIDLFCGIGGLTHGLEQSGIKVVAGIDVDSSCKYAYETNNKSKFIEKDISNVSGEDLNKLYPKNAIKVLVGCAPCQTFSKHTLKNKDRENDERYGLLNEFLRLVRESKPDLVSMENVSQLRKYDVFQNFVDGLIEENYFVSYKVVNCLRYGIPQKRSRLVLFASKKSEVELIPETNKPQNYVAIKDIISHLPKIKDGETHKSDNLHKSMKLSPTNKKRIIQSKQGGSWHDWDSELILECHKKKSGKTYSAVYGRMKWNQPAPTITTQFFSYGTGRFGHPNQNRAISLREGALLQTFPEKYDFYPEGKDIYLTKLGRHIGNAVPVDLGKVIGKSIKKHYDHNENI